MYTKKRIMAAVCLLTGGMLMAMSVKTEPGVVSIFPMQDKKNPCQFRS